MSKDCASMYLFVSMQGSADLLKKDRGGRDG